MLSQNRCLLSEDINIAPTSSFDPAEIVFTSYFSSRSAVKVTTSRGIVVEYEVKDYRSYAYNFLPEVVRDAFFLHYAKTNYTGPLLSVSRGGADVVVLDTYRGKGFVGLGNWIPLTPEEIELTNKAKQEMLK